MKNFLVNSVLTLIIIVSINYKRDIPREVAKHVVKLSNIDGSSGTGFYVSYKGKTFLVTNKHVCGDAKYLTEDKVLKEVLALDTHHDLCILSSTRSVGLELASVELESLDKVFVVGHPLGNPSTVRSGRYVETVVEFDPTTAPNPVAILNVSVAVFGGNSGSPVLNSNGEVVGVIFAQDSRTYADGAAVTQEDLIKFLDKHK